jgi:hypothetical protein
MSSKMSSIRSVLIKTCMANIQKEISQLEHWLNNLPEDESSSSSSSDTSELTSRLNKLENDLIINKIAFRNQELVMNNILSRIDALEGFHDSAKKVFINENDQVKDPWVDNICEPLQNEIIDNNSDNSSDSLYRVGPQVQQPTQTSSTVSTPSIIPDIPEDKSIPPEIESDSEDAPAITNTNISKLESLIKKVEVEEEEVEEEEVEEEVGEKEVEEEVGEKEVEEEEVEEEEVEEEVGEKEVEEEEVEEEEVEEEEVEEEEVEEEEVEEEEVEEEEVEEEEEGIELEKIQYKTNTYYKDSEGFIYSIDEDEQPSENPIGYWKEKTQTIAFYKTK